MATEADIRQRIESYLFGDYPTNKPFESILNEALDTTETAVDVLDGDDWEKGDILEVVETGERMRVLSVATNTLTVSRAYGQVAGTAAADQGLVRKNPRFTYDQITNSIKDSVNSLDSWGIHSFNTGSFALVASQYFYELSDTDIDEQYGVLSVYYPDDTTEQPVPLPYDVGVRLDTSPAEWGSSFGVTLKSKGDRDSGESVYYTYAQSLKFDTDLSTTLAKLPVQSEELVVLGAVSRLMGKTIAPATQDPGARTDRTTPPGQTTRDGRWFQGEFFIKARAEAARIAVIRQRVPGSVRSKRAGRWRA